MKQIETLPNSPGARGWVWAGKYKLERYLYLLHRITGLGLILFVMIHLVMTTVFRIQGQEVWEATMGILRNPWFKVGEYLVIVAFVYHALNGLRLALQELGFTLGKPIPPVYPYTDALRKKRPFALIMVALSIVFALVFLFDFLVGGW